MGTGSDIVAMIDDLVRALRPGAGIGPDDLWKLVLKLESSLGAEGLHSEAEHYLMARVKAGVSFVIEAQRNGRNPPHDEALAPLAALRTQVTARAADKDGLPDSAGSLPE